MSSSSSAVSSSVLGTGSGKLYSLRVFVPVSHAPQVRAALGSSGAGSMGNYDSASFSWRGVGRFRPLSGATPFIGSVGSLEQVEEEAIETEIRGEYLEGCLKAIKAAHPYEHPGIHISEILKIDWASISVPSTDAAGAGK